MKVHKVMEETVLLLENGQPAAKQPEGAVVVHASGNARVGEAAKAPKAVVHRNTRFTS